MLRWRLEVFFVLVLQLVCSPSKAQADTIYLMNGHIITASVRDTAAGSIRALTLSVPVHTLNYSTEQLYKVSYASGKHVYYYIYDTLRGNWLSVQDMWLYMKGERDARAGYKARGAMAGAFVTGLVGGMTGTFWAPALPLTYAMFTGLPKTKIKRFTVSDQNLLKSDAYLMGYVRVAKQKNKLRALLSGGAGLLLGYGVYFMAHNYYPQSL